MTAKPCKKCGELLPLLEFYKHQKMADGHLNFCKACVRSRVANHRNENLDACRQYDRERALNPLRKKQLRERFDRLRSDPVRLKTWRVTSNAIRNGKLVRPSSCSSCKCLCKPEAHHENYEKPLDVIWLCRSCHCKLHSTKT
jgi:hypothetical protein